MKSNNKPTLFLIAAIVAVLLLLISGPFFIQSIPVVLTQTFALLLIAWGMLSRKLNKHHSDAHKLPQGYFFVTKGPYEIIRHPIYAGLLLFVSGFIQGAPSLTRYLLFIVFLVAIVMKMLYEEKVLEERSKDYLEYQKKTHKLIPYLY